ncbi:MAG: AAA family ATPase [Magnetospirillum sp. WYHS-4]
MHIISDNDLFQRLVFENPWWDLKPDTRIEFRASTQRIFFPSFFNRMMGAGAGDILVLTGPLRGGKTVMLRQTVARLIEGGVKPTHVFYASLTTPSLAGADLAVLFEMFLRRYRHGPEAELYVFFDEAEYVADWQKTVSQLARMRPRTRFVCAVSAGAPAGGEANAGGGRYQVFVLPPLTFVEFLRFRGSEDKLFGPGAGKPHGKAVFKETLLPVLNEEFMRYINFGGFPEGILGKTEGAPAPTFIRDGLTNRVLHKDLPGLFGISDAQEVNRVLTVLAFNTGREISIDEIAKVTGIAKNTIRKYLDFLISAHLIRRLDRVDQNGNPFQRAVGFKVLLSTPCLYASLFGPSPIGHDAFPRLVQCAVVAQWRASEAENDLSYAVWRGGGVDLVGFDPRNGKPSAAFEMDWNDHYAQASKGPGNLIQFVKGSGGSAKAFILTHSLARPGRMQGVDITLAPASLYCYWLGRGRHPHRAETAEV